VFWSNPEEQSIKIVTYAIPIAPGRTRVIYRFIRNYLLLPSFLRFPPEWLEHLKILKVLDSDTVFLHGQVRVVLVVVVVVVVVLPRVVVVVGIVIVVIRVLVHRVMIHFHNMKEYL
jgi:hypothetical protein